MHTCRYVHKLHGNSTARLARTGTIKGTKSENYGEGGGRQSPSCASACRRKPARLTQNGTGPPPHRTVLSAPLLSLPSFTVRPLVGVPG